MTYSQKLETRYVQVNGTRLRLLVSDNFARWTDVFHDTTLTTELFANIVRMNEDVTLPNRHIKSLTKGACAH